MKNHQYAADSLRKAMTFMQILGFLSSLLIGLSLGVMGGGGSILTTPVLVYLLGVNPVLSTAYSLFVVGTTSLVGAVNYSRNQQIHYRSALLLALPSFGSILFTRRYFLPAIPDPIFIHDSFRISKGIAFMLLFTCIMLVASISMITPPKIQQADTTSLHFNYFRIVVIGLFIGCLTGLAGIGGGFLIVPTLVLLVRLPMKRAVGTSLLIIALNSLVGFLSDTTAEKMDWPFLLIFTGLAISGILLGSYLSRFISGYRLRKSFGWFTLGLSLCILGKEGLIPLIVNRSVKPTSDYAQSLDGRALDSISREKHHKFGPPEGNGYLRRKLKEAQQETAGCPNVLTNLVVICQHRL